MSLTLTLGALGLFAQPTGFGGFQMPKVDVRCSQKIADVDYAGDGQVYHKLDIYLPKVEKDTYPVVVHIYGSAWFSNNSKGMADLGTIVNALLDAGYAVVCPNHRSSMDAKFPAQIHDIKGVVRFVKANAAKYKFDPSFVAAGGEARDRHVQQPAPVGRQRGRQPAVLQRGRCGLRLVRPRGPELYELRRPGGYLEPRARGGRDGLPLQGQ